MTPDGRQARDRQSAVTVAAIEIRIESLAQLFDALDPAPLSVRALDGSASRYILARAAPDGSPETSRLVVHLPESLRGYTVNATNAIHEHFRRAHANGERAFRRRLRIVGRCLWI